MGNAWVKSKEEAKAKEKGDETEDQFQNNETTTKEDQSFPNLTPLLEKDRIVELNGFKLFVTDDMRPHRRNVVCFSQQAKRWITEHGLDKNHPNHVMQLMKEMNLNQFQDVMVVYVKGYY